MSVVMFCFGVLIGIAASWINRTGSVSLERDKANKLNGKLGRIIHRQRIIIKRLKLECRRWYDSAQTT